jgi:hypothetical protein
MTGLAKGFLDVKDGSTVIAFSNFFADQASFSQRLDRPGDIGFSQIKFLGDSILLDAHYTVVFASKQTH